MPYCNGEIFGIRGEVPYGSILISPESIEDIDQIKKYPILAELPAYLGIQGIYQSEKIYLVEEKVAEQMKEDGIQFYEHGRWPMPK